MNVHPVISFIMSILVKTLGKAAKRIKSDLLWLCSSYCTEHVQISFIINRRIYILKGKNRWSSHAHCSCIAALWNAASCRRLRDRAILGGRSKESSRKQHRHLGSRHSSSCLPCPLGKHACTAVRAPLQQLHDHTAGLNTACSILTVVSKQLINCTFPKEAQTPWKNSGLLRIDLRGLPTMKAHSIPVLTRSTLRLELNMWDNSETVS